MQREKITPKIMPTHAGRTPVITLVMKLLVRKRSKKIDASRHTVSVGDSVPRFAAIAPKKPAVRMPAKVAQFSPSGPGVISAMATISETSAAVIQPWEVISEVISGIIESPPKLVNPIFKKLMYRAFMNAKRQCDKWGDFKMNIAPYDSEKPIYYEFTECPTAEFAKKHGFLEVMPALCNPDFEGMECIHARLVRTTTCANGDRCNYSIVGDRDPYLKDHPEYRDDAGYRRNK